MGPLGLLLLSCSGSDAPTPSTIPAGSAIFGQGCQTTEECASTLCVRVDEAGGICTERCETDDACPEAGNWACLAAGSELRVCACHKTGESEVCGDGLDNECNGKVDDCQQCSGVEVPLDDPANCGSCGNACRADQRCSDLGCLCADSGRVECGTTCSDLASDPSNCGGCGVACGESQVCTGGACECSNAAEIFCADSGCVDLATDGENCGECGNACDLGRACRGAACACPAAEAPDFCAGLGCVDLATDLLNCGECANACAPGLVCDAGECVCATGFSECDGACVNLDTDPDHCGGCGQTCGDGQSCAAGECGCGAFGFSVCGDVCADLDNDEANCGDCGNACLVGEVCSYGQCGCESELYCGGECVPVDDDDNCGACGEACPSGQLCSGGTCVCQGFGLSPCGDVCVALGSDEANCGYCDHACKNGESCSSGNCSCSPGQTYCDEAGTCVSLSSDAEHCGACGAGCDATETCQSSECQCPTSGALFCESEGICVDTLNNAQHCGACDAACDPTEICQNKVCKCSSTNQKYCDAVSACVDITSDELHCGDCGVECPAQTSCISKVCKCDQVGRTLCPDDVCYDLTSDPDHCGSCSGDCGGNYSCIGSKCACADPIVGTEVRVSNHTNDDYEPVVAWDGNHLGVVYRSLNVTIDWLRFVLLNPDGSKSFDSGLVQQIYTPPTLAWTGSEYGIGTTSFTSAQLFRFDAAGAAVAAPLDVDTSLSDFVRLAWSAPYGGYGWVYAFGAYDLGFQRIGADGTNPEAEHAFSLDVNSFTSPFVVGPDGSWALAYSEDDGARLVVFNPDGSLTLPVAVLATSAPGRPGLAHDGTTFLTAFPQYDGIYVNRGTAKNAPVKVFSIANDQLIGDVAVVMVNGTVVLGWTQRNNVASNNPASRYRLQRFALPSDSSSNLKAIGNIVEVTASTYVGGYQGIGLAATSPDSLLAVWADNRLGATSREIYAAPIDLGGCP